MPYAQKRTRPSLVDQLRELLREQKRPIPKRDLALFGKLNDVANEHALLALSRPKAAPAEEDKAP